MGYNSVNGGTIQNKPLNLKFALKFQFPKQVQKYVTTFLEIYEKMFAWGASQTIDRQMIII